MWDAVPAITTFPSFIGGERREGEILFSIWDNLVPIIKDLVAPLIQHDSEAIIEEFLLEIAPVKAVFTSLSSIRTSFDAIIDWPPPWFSMFEKISESREAKIVALLAKAAPDLGCILQ